MLRTLTLNSLMCTFCFSCTGSGCFLPSALPALSFIPVVGSCFLSLCLLRIARNIFRICSSGLTPLGLFLSGVLLSAIMSILCLLPVIFIVV